MPRIDLLRFAAGLALAASAIAAAQEPLLRHQAPVRVEQSAAFVRLPLPLAVYARAEQPDLADLRLFDAAGNAVPFAVLGSGADELRRTEQLQAAALYALPPRPAAGGVWASPVDVVVEGGRIVVRQRGAAARVESSAGWLFDLGERSATQAAPQLLRLQWSGPAEFSSAYALEHSAELRQWQPAAGGQLMALVSSTGSIAQREVPLPADVRRFVRLSWAGPGPQPVLTAAQSVTVSTRSQALDAPTELRIAPSAEPRGAAAGPAVQRALHFDLGAVLPLLSVALQPAAGTLVLPVRLQGRERVDRPWQELAGTVFYRIERGAQSVQSPPLELQQRLRYLRLLPDERSAAPQPEALSLVVQAQLASLVFAAQGTAPYRLQVGSEKARTGALPLATLVPDLDAERPRFGRATLGEFSEPPAAAEQARSQAQRAALRPWLLWALLLAGVLGLAFAVWRLARAPRP